VATLPAAVTVDTYQVVQYCLLRYRIREIQAFCCAMPPLAT
jgi:hypothetical protein